MTGSVAGSLDLALRAANIPIDGVSIWSESDRATWKVRFAPDATDAQKASAAQIVSTFNPSDPAVIASALTAEATQKSRQKDILATIAFVVRASNVSAWNAMTTPQKKAAVLAQADNWRDLRVWIEQNVT